MDMDQGVRGWLFNTARENYWRVSGWIEFDDLVQEGFLCYARLKNKYPNVTEPRHMMRLFQTTYRNHITTLAKKRTRCQIEVTESAIGTAIAEIDLPTFTPPDTSLICATLPALLRKVVDTIQNDPRMHARYRRRHNHRETTDERLCRLIGTHPLNERLLDRLRAHLKGDFSAV